LRFRWPRPWSAARF